LDSEAAIEGVLGVGAKDDGVVEVRTRGVNVKWDGQAVVEGEKRRTKWR
jgi:hypothetical protein